MRKLGGSKKGAIELSIGTIVILVLSMSMLVLGLVLLRSIFDTAGSAIDQTDAAVREKLNGLIGEDKGVAIYPRNLELKIGKDEEIGIRIKNLLDGDSSGTSFSYDTAVSDLEGCNMREDDAFRLMQGYKDEVGEIRSGADVIERVRFNAPEGTPICSFKIRVNVKADGKPYDSDNIFVNIKG